MNYVLQILYVLALMGVGFGARRRGVVGESGTTEMVRVLVAIVYPCLIFSSVTQLHASDLAANWALPLLAMAIAGTGLALGCAALAFMKNIDRNRASAFLFQNTINNYLFLPLPLVMLMWGTQGVALLVFASMGFEVTVWTVGVYLFNRSNRLAEGLRMMLSPPLITLLVSICWVCVRDLLHPAMPTGVPGGEILHRCLELLHAGADTIGRATIALSMIVSGSRISALNWRAVADPHVWLVSALRLVATPVLFILLLKALPLEATARGILCVVATMPAAVASLIFSERFGGDSDFVASTLLATHVGAIITIPLLLAWAL